VFAHLQQELVRGAGASEQGLLGVQQVVRGVERRRPVRLHVLEAVRRRAREARAHRRPLHPRAYVAGDRRDRVRRRRRRRRREEGIGLRFISAARGRSPSPPVLGLECRSVAGVLVFVGDEGEHFVDVEQGPLAELPFAKRTRADGTGGPVAPDAGLRTDETTTTLGHPTASTISEQQPKTSKR